MKNLFLIGLLFISQLCFSQVQEAKTNNNISVVLNNDGTWSYTKVNKSENVEVLDKYTKWVNPDVDVLKDQDTETYSINKSIYVRNGVKKDVPIKLLWKFGRTYPKMTLRAINLIILQGNIASKAYCKHADSYIPIGFYITKSNQKNQGIWTLHSKFKGFTEYGVVKEFNKFFYFDLKGNLLNQ